MPDFITMSCPSCGGKLQITNDIERFACAYCGTEHIVKRIGGVISLAPVIEEMKATRKAAEQSVVEVKGVRKATDNTASELAMARIDKEHINLSAIKEKESLLRGCDNTFNIILAICFLIFGFILISMDYSGAAIIAWIISFIFIILVGRNAAKRKKRREEIDLRLATLREEYQRHKNIVDHN